MNGDYPSGTAAGIEGDIVDYINTPGTPVHDALSATIVSALPSKNLRDFGAVGDGVTDDTDAVQAWLDAGGNLYAPTGTYLCDGATRPRLTQSQTTITGDGPNATVFVSSILYDGTPEKNIDLIIVGEGASNPTLELDSITIQDVGFQFTGPNPTRGGGACLRVSRSRNVNIRRVKTLYGSIGIHLDRVETFWVHDNEVSSSKADGIQGTNGSDNVAGMTVRDGFVFSNYVHDTNDDGIAFGGNHDGDLYRSQPENIHVFSNRIGPVLTAGGGIGIYGVKNVRVTNNQITNPRTHFMAVLIDNQYDQYPSENVDISDNLCVSSQSAAGGNVSGPVSIYLGGRNATFSGNELDVPFVKNVRISRNRFIVNDRSGIWCQPASTMGSHPNKWLDTVTIEDNSFIFTGTAPPNDYRGMHLQYIRNLTIQRNRIEGMPSGAMVLNQFTSLRYIGNQHVNCCANAAHASRDDVSIGAAATATDTVEDFSQNVFRKTSGTVNRMLNLRADGSAGAFPYEGNRFYTTGATITTATETFQNRPTVPHFIGQSGWDRGHPTIGVYHLWVDATGDLRIKSSAPTSDTDGTVVGTQT